MQIVDFECVSSVYMAKVASLLSVVTRAKTLSHFLITNCPWIVSSRLHFLGMLVGCPAKTGKILRFCIARLATTSVFHSPSKLLLLGPRHVQFASGSQASTLHAAVYGFLTLYSNSNHLSLSSCMFCTCSRKSSTLTTLERSRARN